jgi:hypothetical protein
MKTNDRLTAAIRVTPLLSYLCPPRRNPSVLPRLTLSLFLGTTLVFAQSVDPTIKEDLATRSADIHWPSGFSPSDAALFAHNGVFIKAPCATVWQHLVRAQNWTAWYPNAQDVKISNNRSGALEPDSIFEWSTFGLPITSFVHEFVPNSRLAWFGKSSGLDAVFYHTWYLVPTSDGCQMITEEVVQGPGAIAFRDRDPSAMHRGHEAWLNGLKQVSER